MSPFRSTAAGPLKSAVPGVEAGLGDVHIVESPAQPGGQFGVPPRELRPPLRALDAHLLGSQRAAKGEMDSIPVTRHGGPVRDELPIFPDRRVGGAEPAVLRSFVEAQKKRTTTQSSRR